MKQKRYMWIILVTSAAGCFVHTGHKVMALKDEMIRIKSLHRKHRIHRIHIIHRTNVETGAEFRNKLCSFMKKCCAGKQCSLFNIIQTSQPSN